MSLRQKLNDDGWYGAVWVEFFVSFVLAKVIQALFWPTAWMLLLLPGTWIVVHRLIGKWLERHSKGDIFGRDK